MSTSCELSLIIPTCPPRAPKLRALLNSIAATNAERGRFEVVLTVDAQDAGPLALARDILPAEIAVQGLTQAHAGPAGARNWALAHARGAWLLFLDDDMRLEPGTIPAHLARIRRAPDATLAYLGRADPPPERLRSPWDHLLAETAMVFFWNTIRPGRRYGFRYFWTCHLSVRAECVRACGGFDARFPDAMHEDIELGWRLAERAGMHVEPLLEARGWHDHALSPREYFFREYRSGRAAAAARSINPAFYAALWGRLRPAQMHELLQGSFRLAARQVLARLQEWSRPSSRHPSADELQLAYLAHLPLKRLMFCHGFLDLPFEELWHAVQPDGDTVSAGAAPETAADVLQPAITRFR